MRRPKTCGDDPVAPIEDSPSFAVVGGLTKREYFAAMAMQGLLAHPGTWMMQWIAEQAVQAADPTWPCGRIWQAVIAEQAVQAADELIDALNAE